MLAIGGTDEALEPFLYSLGPWIVEDIGDAKNKLMASEASVMREINDSSTGRTMHMKHADASVVEYLQWAPKLIEQYGFAPLRAGTPALQI